MAHEQSITVEREGKHFIESSVEPGKVLEGPFDTEEAATQRAINRSNEFRPDAPVKQPPIPQAKPDNIYGEEGSEDRTALVPDPAMERAKAAGDQSEVNAFRHDVNKAAEESPNVDETSFKEFMSNLPGETMDALVKGARAAPSEIPSIGPGLARGAISGVENAINGINELAGEFEDFTGDANFFLGGMGAAGTVKRWVEDKIGAEIDVAPLHSETDTELPKPEESDRFTGQTVEVLSEFLVGFIPAFKAAKGIKGLQGLGKFGRDAVASIPAGAFAGFFTLDEDQDNALRALIDVFPDLEGPVTDFLATDEDDPALLNRARRAVEESILGPVGDAVFKGLVWTRQAWKNMGRKSLPEVAPEGGLPGPDTADFDIRFGSLDEDAPVVGMSSDVERASQEFLAQSDTLSKSIPRELTEEQVERSITYYTGSGYQQLNSVARKFQQNQPDNIDEALRLSDVRNPEKFKEAVAGLDVATTQNQTLAETLWRGQNMNNARLGTLKPGDIYRDGGFMSTSRTQKMAESFVSMHSKPGEVPVLMEIESVPGGTMLDVGNRGIPTEREVLFPRETAFEVVEVTQTADGLPLVKLRLAPNETRKGFSYEDMREVPELALNINLRKMNTREDIKFAIQKVDELMASEFRGLREAVNLPEVEIRALSDATGVPVSKLTKQWGEDTPSRIQAARTLLASSAGNLLKAAQRAKASRDPADMVAFRKTFAVHTAIQAEVVGRAANAGRNLRQFNMPAGSNDGLAKNLERLIEQHGGADFSSEMAERVMQLSPEQLARAPQMADPRKWPAKASDVFFEWWINALLSSPATHAVNTLSNSATALWSIPENALAQAAENGITAGAVSAMARMHGLMAGMKDGARLAAHLLRYSDIPEGMSSKIDINRIPESIAMQGDSLTASAINLLGQVVRIPGRLLMSEDQFFKAIAYRMKIHEAAALRAYQGGARGKEWAGQYYDALRDPTDDLRMAAIDEAEYLTFTRRADFPGAQELVQARNKVPALKLFFPFVNTPANILSYTFERTPLAPLGKRYRDAIEAGGETAAKAKAKMWLGTTQMAAFASYASEGLITGSGPADPDLRRVWLEDHQPYSIKVGDNWVQYSRLDPAGFLIGAAADFTQIAGALEEGQAGEAIAMAVTASMANLTDKTYLAGLSMLNEFLSSGHATPELDMHTLQRTLRQLGSSILVPRVVFSVRQAMDPNLRAVDDFMGQLKSQVPGYSDELPSEHNIWGEPVLPSPGMGEGNMAALYRSISPLRSRPVTDDPVNKVLLDNDIGVSNPNRTIQGVRLTTTEYQFLKVARGQRARKAVEKLIETVDFKSAPRHIKESMVRNIFTQAGKVARAELIQAYPDLVTRLQHKRKFDLETDPTEMEQQ